MDAKKSRKYRKQSAYKEIQELSEKQHFYGIISPGPALALIVENETVQSYLMSPMCLNPPSAITV